MTEDEASFNTTGIVLLKTLSHLLGVRRLEWVHNQAQIGCPVVNVFDAYTDGVLRSRQGGNVFAIFKVKKRTHANDLAAIMDSGNLPLAETSGLRGRVLRDSIETGSLAYALRTFVTEYSTAWKLAKIRLTANPSAALLAHEILCTQNIPNVRFTPVLQSVLIEPSTFFPTEHETPWIYLGLGFNEESVKDDEVDGDEIVGGDEWTNPWNDHMDCNCYHSYGLL
ncbi:hypothetical protein N7466_003168 [Penicillium verhagenii]|uniref:uncharacterized protein n=1 Tax=Penicillium verhagenii TaxID=1562060 RepID=UPI00254550C6|nr:uncharacterized protein N7466_003168 [Penicillium verhagenii]KAJ5936718.1 hypothetical protein N7466_003168 [Penicillium verhagenii]